MKKVVWMDKMENIVIDYWKLEDMGDLYFLEKCGEIVILSETALQAVFTQILKKIKKVLTKLTGHDIIKIQKR